MSLLTSYFCISQVLDGLEDAENASNTRRWLKSHHDTLFPFFPHFKKRSIKWLFDKLKEEGCEKGALYVHTIGVNRLSVGVQTFNLGLGAGAMVFLADCYVKHKSTSEKLRGELCLVR